MSGQPPPQQGGYHDEAYDANGQPYYHDGQGYYDQNQQYEGQPHAAGGAGQEPYYDDQYVHFETHSTMPNADYLTSGATIMIITRAGMHKMATTTRTDTRVTSITTINTTTKVMEVNNKGTVQMGRNAFFVRS
jgi:hypothetical protein